MKIRIYDYLIFGSIVIAPFTYMLAFKYTNTANLIDLYRFGFTCLIILQLIFSRKIYLNKVYTNPELPNVKLLTKKEISFREVNIDNPYPKTIYFNFDKACNLKCPSCRLTLIHNGQSVNAEMTLSSIEKQFGKFVRHIVITGSGDPFYSNVFRNWLQNFDISK